MGQVGRSPTAAALTARSTSASLMLSKMFHAPFASRACSRQSQVPECRPESRPACLLSSAQGAGNAPSLRQCGCAQRPLIVSLSLSLDASSSAFWSCALLSCAFRSKKRCAVRGALWSEESDIERQSKQVLKQFARKQKIPCFALKRQARDDQEKFKRSLSDVFWAEKKDFANNLWIIVLSQAVFPPSAHTLRRKRLGYEPEPN